MCRDVACDVPTVLIPILMDDPLGVEDILIGPAEAEEVLIPILMDDPLGGILHSGNKIYWRS